MRVISLVIFGLLAAVYPAAAQTCESAVSAALPLLEDAQARIEADEPELALALISGAQALLAVCQETIEPANIPPTPETEVVSAPSSQSAAMVTPPDVDLEMSIAFIAFAHTSVDAGPIDIYTGNSVTPVIANLNFGEATALIPFNGGPRTFLARPAGSGAAGDLLYEVRWDYLANSSWILTAAGLRDELAFIVEPISIVRNDYNERARVRVVNFVPDRRVTVRGTNGVVFGDGLGWIGIKDTLVDAGSYELEVRTSDGEKPLEALRLEIEAATTYTLYIIGRGDADLPVRVLPIITPQDMTRVRFVNAGADGVDIHYRPGNERLVDNLPGGETTDYVALASGAVTFIAYAPGTGPTGRELAALPLQLRPGREVTVTLGANTMEITEVALIR